MSGEKGEQVFGNIDELLADKIIAHSKEHTGTEITTPDDTNINQNATKKEQNMKKRSGNKMIIMGVLAILTLIVVGGIIFAMKSCRE